MALLSLAPGSALAASSSSVSLSISAPTAIFGAAVSLTATVAPVVATGKVTFYEGQSVLGFLADEAVDGIVL